MDLSRAVWIGGSPCAGKSTIAAILARRHGLGVYATDPLESRPATSDQPMKRHFQALDPDELWLRPAAVQAATELDYCREELALAVAELRQLAAADGVVVEGTALLPQGVVPLLTRPAQAVWLVPTPQFQRRHYPRRGAWVRDVVSRTSDPDLAFERWMERDVRYGRVVAATAHALDQRVIEVDGSRPVEDLADEVADHLGLEAGGSGG